MDERTKRILNHVSHNGIYVAARGEKNTEYAFSYDGMAEEAAKSGFLLSYDGMEIDF